MRGLKNYFKNEWDFGFFGESKRLIPHCSTNVPWTQELMEGCKNYVDITVYCQRWGSLCRLESEPSEATIRWFVLCCFDWVHASKNINGRTSFKLCHVLTVKKSLLWWTRSGTYAESGGQHNIQFKKYKNCQHRNYFRECPSSTDPLSLAYVPGLGH